jgi:hypothetical protein
MEDFDFFIFFVNPEDSDNITNISFICKGVLCPNS